MTRVIGCLGGIAGSLSYIAGGIESSIKRIGSYLCVYERVGGITTSVELINNISVTSNRVGGVKSRVGLVCAPGIGIGVLWASDGRLITIEGGFLIVR